MVNIRFSLLIKLRFLHYGSSVLKETSLAGLAVCPIADIFSEVYPRILMSEGNFVRNASQETPMGLSAVHAIL